MSARLLGDASYGPMFWTQFAGAFNDNFFKNALVILVAYKSQGAGFLGPDQLVAVAGALFILPFFLFSATAGQLADKYEKAALVRRIKVLEIAIMVLGAAGLVAGRLDLLLVVLFLMGTQSAFFGPVKYGILPQLLRPSDLVGGNALVEMATYLAILGGTLLGGLLVNVEVGGAPVGTWLVAAGVVALAWVGWGTSTRIPACPPEDPELTVRWLPFAPTLQILRDARDQVVIWRAILAISWFWGMGTVFLALFPSWTKEVLFGAETVATLFLAMFSVGIGVGSMLCERLSRQRLELGVVPIGSFGMSVFTLDLWLVGQPWAAPADGTLLGVGALLSTVTGWRLVVDLLGVAIFGGMFVVPLYTLLQQRAPPESRSRVIAANNIVNAAVMVGMAALLVPLQQAFSAPALFALLATVNALVALYIYTVVPEFMLRFCAWMLSNVLYRVDMEGHERIPESGPCVVVCNHVSFVDWLVLLGAIKRPVRFVMHYSFHRLPVIGWLSRQAGVIPIASEKEDPAVKAAAFEAIHQALDEGWIVGIFPEGRITFDGEMQTFRRGVVQIVERDPVPVVPLALNGLWGSWFSRKDGGAIRKRPRRFWSRVFVTIDAPVPPAEVTVDGLEARVRALWEAGPP